MIPAFAQLLYQEWQRLFSLRRLHPASKPYTKDDQLALTCMVHLTTHGCRTVMDARIDIQTSMLEQTESESKSPYAANSLAAMRLRIQR